MAIETSTKATLHQRAMHELKELAIISAYLYVTLGAVIMMKTAVLRTEGGVEFIPWGIAIVKAVVLGKFVLLGNMVHVGGRDISGPLIWPTLRRAFAFLVLLVVLTTIEEAVVGLFHHRSIAAQPPRANLPYVRALVKYLGQIAVAEANDQVRKIDAMLSSPAR